MESLLPTSQWLHATIDPFLTWVDERLLVAGTLLQLACIALLVTGARYLAARSARWLEALLERRGRKSIIRMNATYRELFFLAYGALALWMAVMVAQGAALPFGLLSTAASLLSAWAVIRLTSSTMESVFLSRVVAVVLWVLAALVIVGWFEPAVERMDAAAIKLGTVRLSLLLLFKGIVAFAILFWAIGFISGVLERGFNKAQGLNPSQRVLFYKVSNIVLYTIGGLVGLNIIGLDLTALTVFSGALGLGIGFGLQRIFANLISGLILLLDKSVKPGDVIAIGETYGWVNALGARYVSVLTRDGKEHLIPNENLITEKVENWSYSDQRVRIRVPVGVSYHSDLHLVKRLLLQAVADHPRILKDPAPACLITGFDEGMVKHELRIWIADAANGVSNVASDIYYRVWDLFRQHDIQVPYPQQEVHVSLKDHPALDKILSALADKKA